MFLRVLLPLVVISRQNWIQVNFINASLMHLTCVRKIISCSKNDRSSLYFFESDI